MASSQEVSHGMAMSEQATQKGEGSEPRRSGNAVSQPLFLMNGVVEDKPNNYVSTEKLSIVPSPGYNHKAPWKESVVCSVS